MLVLGTKNRSQVLNILTDFNKYLRSKNIKYIEISIDYNNDYLYNDLPKDITVITRVQSLDNLDLTLGFHMNKLGKDRDYIILLPSGRDEYPEETVKNVRTVGLYGVSGSMEIENFIESTGRVPDYVSLKINPFLYPKSTLDFCKDKGIKTIGYEIYGGEIYYGYLKNVFPDKFLLEFAEHNTDLQVIPSDNADFIISLLGSYKESEVTNNKLYEYSKDVNVLPSIPTPVQKIFGETEINIEGSVKFTGEFDSSREKMKPGKIETKIISGEEDETLKKAFSEIVIPEDIDLGNLKELQAYHRYYSGPCLDEVFNPKVWKKYVRVASPGLTVLKIVPRSWIGWMTKEHSYLMITMKGEKYPKIYKIPFKTTDNLISEG